MHYVRVHEGVILKVKIVVIVTDRQSFKQYHIAEEVFNGEIDEAFGL